MTERGIEPAFPGSDNVYSVTNRGNDLAAEFLAPLDVKVKARFAAMLKKLDAGERLKNPEHFRQIRGVEDTTGHGAAVFELKVSLGPGYRLYVVRYVGKWYVTHGRKKPKDRQVIAEARRALAIFHADL